MRIFLAGATGALGRRLMPLLVAGGHQIVATTRTDVKMAVLRETGAEPVLLDGLDREAVMKAVKAARPEAVVHQMTFLSKMKNLKRFDEEFTLTNRLRTEGINHLLDAARAAGTRIFVAQSYSGWPNIREGSRVKTEDDPLDPNPPAAMARTLAAIRELETTVSSATDLTGIVLRYGSFYGPGTSLGQNGEIVELVRQRRFPIFGNGTGVWSFIHIDDAAAATQAAIESGAPGIYNIVDDEPAEISVWLPELARAVDGKPPYRLPAWLGLLVIGEVGMSIMTKVRGSSNAKAKRVLNWRPVYPSWREGFQHL